MDFGVVLQTDPPAARVIDLAKRAETYGFTHAWTFDSHLLWQEPFVIYSRILNETHKLHRRAAGDEPVHARPHGHRVALRDAQRDVRQPHDLRDRARRLRRARHQRAAGAAGGAARGRRRDPRSGQRRERRVPRRRRCGCPWSPDSQLPIWIAGYGPKALALTGEIADGFVLQLADPEITAWSIAAVRGAAEAAGRDPDAITMCVAAPAYVSDDLAHARDQCRWFGGMVGNHVAEIVGALRGRRRAPSPQALTDYIAGRAGLRLQRARAGGQRPHGVRARRDRRPLLPHRPARGADRAAARARRDLGVDQFALYLQHDAKDGDARGLRRSTSSRP